MVTARSISGDELQHSRCSHESRKTHTRDACGTGYSMVVRSVGRGESESHILCHLRVCEAISEMNSFPTFRAKVSEHASGSQFSPGPNGIIGFTHSRLLLANEWEGVSMGDRACSARCLCTGAPREQVK